MVWQKGRNQKDRCEASRRCFENNLTFFVPGRQRSGWYQPCLPVCSIAPIQAELNEFFDTFSSGHCSLTKLSFDKKFRLVISHEFYEPSVHRLVSSADLAARALLAWSVVRLIVLVVAYLLSVVRILGHSILMLIVGLAMLGWAIPYGVANYKLDRCNQDLQVTLDAVKSDIAKTQSEIDSAKKAIDQK